MYIQDGPTQLAPPAITSKLCAARKKFCIQKLHGSKGYAVQCIYVFHRRRCFEEFKSQLCFFLNETLYFIHQNIEEYRILSEKVLAFLLALNLMAKVSLYFLKIFATAPKKVHGPQILYIYRKFFKYSITFVKYCVLLRISRINNTRRENRMHRECIFFCVFLSLFVFYFFFFFFVVLKILGNRLQGQKFLSNAQLRAFVRPCST